MRHMWGTCTDCDITVSWEVAHDAARDVQLPEEELAFFDCPACGESIHEGSDPTTHQEQHDTRLRNAWDRTAAAEKDLRDRELHHFEEEQARAKAEAHLAVLLSALNVALNSDDEDALAGARRALEEVRDEDLTVLKERDAAAASLDELIKATRLDQFTDGYVLVDAATRKAVRWGASLDEDPDEAGRLRAGLAALHAHANHTHDHGWGQLLDVVLNPDGEDLAEYIAIHEEDDQ